MLIFIVSRQKTWRSNNPRPAIKTKLQLQKIRDYNNRKQRESRQRRSGQKHWWVKERDAEYRKNKREEEKMEKSAQCRRNQMKKFTKECVQVLKKIMEARGRAPKEVENQRKSVSTLALKYVGKYFKIKTELAKTMGLRWHYLKSISSLEESSPDSEKVKSRCDLKNIVHDFYLKPTISVSLSGMKTTNRKGQAVKYMNMRIVDAHKDFQKHTGKKIGFSTFAKMRPKTVKLQKAIPRNECICKDCGNVELALEGLRRVLDYPMLASKYTAVNATLCEKPTIQCTLRQCKKCGVKLLLKNLKLTNTDKKKTVSFKQWDYMEKQQKDKVNKYLALIEIEGTLNQALAVLKDHLEGYAWHLHIARWQAEKLKKVSECPPPGSVVFVIDFAQNYLTRFQDEVQSVHWCHNQVTLVPIISYYTCQVCDEVVKSEFMVISDDLNHDVAAAETFLQAVEENLVASGVEIESKINFSDGCARQFKCTPMFDRNSAKQVPISWSYFGSSHGKSICDAATARFKKALKRAVLTREATIVDGKTMNMFANQTLAKEEEHENHQHILQAFLLCNDIKRPSSNAFVSIPTSMVHEVKNVPGERGKILVREESCYCKSCLGGSPCSQFCEKMITVKGKRKRGGLKKRKAERRLLKKPGVPYRQRLKTRSKMKITAASPAPTTKSERETKKTKEEASKVPKIKTEKQSEDLEASNIESPKKTIRPGAQKGSRQIKNKRKKRKKVDTAIEETSQSKHMKKGAQKGTSQAGKKEQQERKEKLLQGTRQTDSNVGGRKKRVPENKVQEEEFAPAVDRAG